MFTIFARVAVSAATFTGPTTTTVAQDAADTSTWLGLLFWPVVLGVFFYFLMIRPQRNRLRRHEQMVASLQAGDEITTIGGIYGVIEYIDDTYAIIRVEGGGKLRVARRALAGKVTG